MSNLRSIQVFSHPRPHEVYVYGEFLYGALTRLLSRGLFYEKK